MAVVAQAAKLGKKYLAPDAVLCPTPGEQVDPKLVPDEPLPYLRSIVNCYVYGIRTWSALFSPRQLHAVAAFANGVRMATERIARFHEGEYAAVINAYLAILVDRLADFNTMLCAWKESAGHTFSRQALGMIWDYSEVNPFSTFTGSWQSQIRQVVPVVQFCAASNAQGHATVARGSANKPALSPNSLDAVLTDPPYYDAVPYADLSDFFYV
jgi:adenine-specific DNA methylase